MYIYEISKSTFGCIDIKGIGIVPEGEVGGGGQGGMCPPIHFVDPLHFQGSSAI